MTQDQINRLSEEYTRHRLPNPLTYDDDSMFADYRQQAKTILEWLLSDHLIVEKNKVQDKYNSLLLTLSHENPNDHYNQMELLEDVFGQETFNPTEK